MTARKKIVTAMCGGLLGLGIYASQVAAHSGQCSKTTTTWNEAGWHYWCYFWGYPGENAEVSSWSGVNPDNGAKALLADLMSSTVTGWHSVSAWAIGINSSGQEIASCRTQTDTSTAEGATVGDGDGCESAVKHRLYARVDDVIR